MPKISIIVPIYKAEKYINRCIDSIIAQTFTDWECILVDDGSPDNSGKICDEYAECDERFRIIHKDNGGVSSARQVGLDLARGDYVIHADPDDWIEPNMLEELYTKAMDIDADMVICDLIFDKSSESYISKQEPSGYDRTNLLLSLFEGKLHGSCCNKLVRINLFEKYNIKFPKQLSVHEDMYVTASLFLRNLKVAYLNKALYHYVIGINENSISQRVGQSYDYDVMIMNMFDELLESDTCKKYAHRLFAKKIVEKEFYRSKCSAFTFIKKCLPYAGYIFYIKNKGMRIKCALSMVGLYKLMLRVHKI